MLEVRILHGDQRPGQQRRNLLGLQHQPILAMGREEVADVERIEADQRHRSAARVADPDDATAVEIEPDTLALTVGLRKIEGPEVNVQGPIAAGIGARRGQIYVHRVAEASELVGYVGEGELRAGEELDGLRIDLGRNRPASAFEGVGDEPVQVVEIAREG